MAFNHFGSSKREDKSRNSIVSHSSIHESKHNKDFHSSIHDHKKIHESMHLGRDRITSPLNRKKG